MEIRLNPAALREVCRLICGGIGNAFETRDYIDLSANLTIVAVGLALMKDPPYTIDEIAAIIKAAINTNSEPPKPFTDWVYAMKKIAETELTEAESRHD